MEIGRQQLTAQQRHRRFGRCATRSAVLRRPATRFRPHQSARCAPCVDYPAESSMYPILFGPRQLRSSRPHNLELRSRSEWWMIEHIVCGYRVRTMMHLPRLEPRQCVTLDRSRPAVSVRVPSQQGQPQGVRELATDEVPCETRRWLFRSACAANGVFG